MNSGRIKIYGLIALAFGGTAICSANTLVDGSTGYLQLHWDTGTYSGGNQGGEFGAYNVSQGNIYSAGTAYTGYVSSSPVSVTGFNFQTFCVEEQEVFYPDQRYAFDVKTTVTFDALGQNNPPKSLTAQAAYLYNKFATGGLSSYSYVMGLSREASATHLQLALWKLQTEFASGSSLDTIYNADAQAKAWVLEAQTAVANHTWTGIGNVRVLNLWKANSDGSFERTPQYAGQDQLILLDGPASGPAVNPTPIPLAAQGGLALVGFLGLTVRRRRQL